MWHESVNGMICLWFCWGAMEAHVCFLLQCMYQSRRNIRCVPVYERQGCFYNYPIDLQLWGSKNSVTDLTERIIMLPLEEGHAALIQLHDLWPIIPRQSHAYGGRYPIMLVQEWWWSATGLWLWVSMPRSARLWKGGFSQFLENGRHAECEYLAEQARTCILGRKIHVLFCGGGKV